MGAAQGSPVASEAQLSARTNRNNSPGNSNDNSCNVGQAQCCQTVYQSQDRSFQFLTSLLGISVPANGLLAGVQCSPLGNTLSILGGSGSCNSQPICCTGNEYHGLVNVGCSPVSL
ncbi:hypothetical protein CPB86DRAFT_695962 [Serendipita vermifera]|nr:hypothetical protein CPB86DRAFT_695962 [Serendipita vermifera]